MLPRCAGPAGSLPLSRLGRLVTPRNSDWLSLALAPEFPWKRCQCRTGLGVACGLLDLLLGPRRSIGYRRARARANSFSLRTPDRVIVLRHENGCLIERETGTPELPQTHYI